MNLLDAAQVYWFQRFLGSEHNGNAWTVDFDLWLWARGENGGYPNLAVVTWPS